MRKRVQYVIVLLIICCAYAAVLIFTQERQSSGDAPTISAPQEVLEVSVKDDDEKLLEGLSAADEEDGDLSDSIFIESMSEFDNDNCRTVTYAVFDSDDNLSRATRRIRYSDYSAPRITLNQALCISYNNYNVQLQDYVGATSSVDGDISAKVSVNSEAQDGNNNYATFSVTDSCGTTSSLRLKIDQLWDEPSLTITLSDYLIYVDKGTEIDAEDYIESVSDRGIEDGDLIDDISIQDNYNADEEGTYEFIYRIERTSGEYGITKLVVVVQ